MMLTMIISMITAKIEKWNDDGYNDANNDDNKKS